MEASVVKTLYCNLPQHLAPKPFITPTHNYYEALGDTSTSHHYLKYETTNNCTNITKVDIPDDTAAKGGVIISSLQANVPLAKNYQTRHNMPSFWTN